jgi:mRNA-degrading endonuclease RelE of RelBE toxin-antitoxin system
VSYEIRLSPLFQAQLEALRAFDHVRIIEAIEEKLLHEPLGRTRNRKPLEAVPPMLAEAAESILENVDAIWELRVVPWRVVYAIEGKVVHVLWIFRKDRETTDDALS